MPKKRKSEPISQKVPETALQYTRLDAGALFTFVRHNLPYRAMKLYWYLNLHCNLANGQGHFLDKQEVADALEMSVRSVEYAYHDLENVGLITVKDHGGAKVDLPRQGFIQQLVHIQSNTKRERLFYQDLQEQLNKTCTPTEQGDALILMTQFDKLATERKENGAFYPKKRDVKLIRQKLADYANDS